MASGRSVLARFQRRVANHLPAPQENRIIKKFSPHPYFDFDVPRNITTRVGQTAFINCRVEQMGDKSVSIGRGGRRPLALIVDCTYVGEKDWVPPDHTSGWNIFVKLISFQNSAIGL
uniref:Uncharacterized protein n=1 Tax=Anopheles stephensi TaxID=30069 RepID=A0A182XZR0_ANOST